MKILDFNPVGGTTSPLLFTWAGAFVACQLSASLACLDGYLLPFKVRPYMMWSYLT